MMLAFCFFTTKERVEAPPTQRLCGKIYVISGKTTSGGLWFTNHFQYPGGVRTRWGDDVYVTWILGTPEVFVAFLTTYWWVT